MQSYGSVKISASLLTFFFLVLLEFHLFAVPDAYQFYTSREDDTFEKIAIRVYSKLPDSETPPTNNRYRGFLIYEENKDSIELEIGFRDYDEDPVVAIMPGETLRIPIYEHGYPTIRELKARIDEELKTVKANIRAQKEAISLRKISDTKTDEIRNIILSFDENGDLLLEDAAFVQIPYILTDGTVLTQSQPWEQELFVWRLIENNQAGKTILLFPNAHSSFRGSYRRFAIMSELALENREKSINIFLESMDDAVDREILDKFREQRELRKDNDYFRILTTPVAHSKDERSRRAAMSASMALYYQNPSTKLKGLEDREELRSFLKAAENEIRTRTDEEYEKYRAEIADHYNKYYTLQSDLFLSELEASIVNAVKKNRITDNNRVKSINDLQLEFARLFVEEGALSFFFGNNDDERKKNIFLSIDTLCGSNTAGIYLSFKKEITAQKHEEEGRLSSGLETLAEELKEILMAELDSKLMEKRDEIISDAFASLPDGSVGILELDVGRVQNQLTLAMRKENYNLIVYYHPLLNDSKKDYSHPQDPEEHKEVLDRFVNSEDFYEGLIIPVEFESRYDSDENARRWINQAYAISRYTGHYYDDQYLGVGRILVSTSILDGLGSILRVSRLEGAKPIDRCYFVPGSNGRDRSKYIEEMVKKESLDDTEKKILLKYAKVQEAAMDL
jgi:hypothetical protein